MRSFAVLGGAGATGLLLALSFPSPEWWPLAWIALVPILIITGRQRPRAAFATGWLAGLIFFLSGLWWVVPTIERYGGIHPLLGSALLLLLAAYLALFIGAFTGLLRIAPGVPGWQWFGAPALWVTLEYLRGHLLSGFPWLALGYSPYRVLPLIQIADVSSVYGISFLIVAANAAVAEAIRRAFAAGPAALGCRRWWNAAAPLVPALGLVFVVVLYGAWRLSTPAGDATYRVALLQGNIPQDQKWDARFRSEILEIYRGLTADAGRSAPDLIVWPETALPAYFQIESPERRQVLDLARETGSYLLIGSPGFQVEPEASNTVEPEASNTNELRGLRMTNSAFLISPGGDVIGRYDKVHLVPFGEYVPLHRLLFFVNKLTAGIGDMVPGPGPAVLSAGSGHLGVLICFEVIFPDLVRQFVQDGADVLVTITNDAWYGRSSAPYQHFSMAVLRAVENRVPLIRAANTGITGIIDPFGRIRSATPLFERTTVVGQIAPGRGSPSFYTRFGDVFALVCGIISLSALRSLFRRRFFP